MASPADRPGATRVRQPPPPPGTQPGLDLSTLIVTAVASAAAAFVCSKVWAAGTLAAAATTPVLVAVFKELLARPTQVVQTVVPVAAVRRRAPAHPGAEPTLPYDAPGAGPSDEEPVSYHTTAARSPHSLRWRLAVVTGLLGFAICVLVYTVPELVAGSSAAGGGRATTLFGGHHHKARKTTTTSTATTTSTTTTPAATVTAPQATVTVPAATQTVPAATAPPATTTTSTAPTTPAATTPAP